MAAPSAPALVLDHYQVERVVGHGTSGRVLRVIDTRTGATRALKVLRAGVDERSLLDEFDQLARLEHPSLPRVYEVGRTSIAIDDIPAGAPYFVAEWIDGVRIDATTGAVDAARLWSVLADLAGALATIHAGGLVHGDVAPQNVLLADDRAVLVDLGLARGTGARGTPAYLAPEALAGHVEPRSDLYGLGATIVRLVTGRPLVEAASLGELAQRILAGAPLRVLPGVPAPLADLVRRLVARDADARPASAIAVLDELDQLAPALGATPSAPTRRARPRVTAPAAIARWPGAESTIAWIVSRLDRATDAAVAITGPAAAGGRLLVDAAIQRWQLARVAAGQPSTVLAGTLDDVAARVDAPAASTTERAWIERVARRLRAAAGLVVIELGDDPRAASLFAALARAPGPRPVVVIADASPATTAGIASQAAPMLDASGLATLGEAMLGARPDASWARGLLVASGGYPLTAIELVRSIATEKDPFAVDWTARSSKGAAEIRTRALATLDDAARVVAIALAAWGGRARLEHVLATARAMHGTTKRARSAAKPSVGLAEVAALERAGLASKIGNELRMERATVDAVEQHATEMIAAAADAALDTWTAGTSSRELAAVVERATLDARRAAIACDVAVELLRYGRADRALAIARRAFDASGSARAGLLAARAASATGAYREAIDLAGASERAGADAADVALVIARAAQRAGDLDAAEEALAQLSSRAPERDDVGGAYARLLVTRARFAEARAVARRSGAPLAGLRAEAAGLAAFYLGDLDEADAAFAALELAASAESDGATVGRALSLRGMVAQQRGQLGLATERYREAVRRLDDAGELHAAATAELNLGTVLSERGRASEALPRLVAAGRVFAELGATTELCAAELNRGNALLAVGQIEDARVAAEAAVARAEGAPHLRAFALLVLGDARKRLGDAVGAARVYREALEIGTDRGDAHAQISAHIALAELGGLESADARAGRTDAEIEALCASADDRDRWTLARARRVLDDIAVPSDLVAALARASAEVAARATDADRIERAFRGHALASALATRARDHALATSEATAARATHARWLAAAAPAFRTALAEDPDLARLPAEATRVDAPKRGDAGPLRRLLTLSRRLNSEANVDRILDDVIDTAIELSSAERGFLLLRQPDGQLAAVVSRNFSTGDLDRDAPTVSRSIAERAAQTGEPVMTVDAGVDERFGMAASVAALRLRSVLAVPLRQRGVITGCIYVDHRLRGGAFDEDAASVLGELADIAAIAIENARLTEDLRRTTRAVDELNQKLSHELAERDAELVRVKADLPDRDRLRHRYDRIVGRSPAMMKMLDIVDRAAATSLPVVIVGESGTGKELVARALHDHGPRKAGAFVAINCSAVPEPLLESELFGHVRGAFTGADRDRRGLFEVADGGTLFLDEIADTSAAMQAKLLRVLQDGVLRRVGDTQTRKVDVRVIAATQRPLAELAAAGRFREDLRFRLEVIAVAVPPLRDREGDIPLLVERMLLALAGDRPAPRLTRAAVRALSQHRWPGNVRELENALARGLAMGGDVIDVGDLPDVIAAATGRPEPTKPATADDLRLKPALAATEQAYISAAMTRAKGNQTVAARLLGLSRFGLQKKLRRLAGDEPDEDDAQD